MEKASKTLTGHLSMVQELTERLESCEGKMPQIEIDMLLSSLRDMYDAVYGLQGNVECGAENGERRTESVEPETEKVEQEEVASVLMVDTEAKPVYADEPEAEPVSSGDGQPTMEEIEGQPNDDLFEEEVGDDAEPQEIPAVEEQKETPQPEPEKADEQPKTLWDKLQDTQSRTTIAETIGAAKSISDILEERKAENEENTRPRSSTTPSNLEGERTDSEQRITEPKTAEEQPIQQTEQQQEQQPAAQPSLFDYFKSSQQDKPAPRTLADTLGGQNQVVEQKVSATKVDDLRTIININDKFSFMNELFHNNMKGYNDFILHLNSLADRDEALAYVQGVAEHYGWDNESIAVKTFYSIFDRKF